jgi:spore photoproduct lyase
MNISKLYIDKKVKNHKETVKILSRINLKPEIVENSGDVFKAVSEAKEPVSAGKKTLFITENKGHFLKECPGTSYYTCCGYKILHIGSFCSMDCSYCILQAYFHPPLLQYFVNKDKLEQEIDELFALKKITRVGTGEFTDSMIWEDLTGISKFLIEKFSNQSSSVLELKTKTCNVESLKNLSHNKKTIISWSLNTEKVIKTEERGTTSLEKRLKTAALCTSPSWGGYPVSFHFDPIIIYDGCEKDYKYVIKKLFEYISPENIVWISLGSFRFIPELKNIIQKRFEKSKIIYGEFIQGIDNKMRYFKPLRIKVYQEIVNAIKDAAPDVLIYFCMEDDEVWEKTLGFLPEEKGGLPAMLDLSAKYHCRLV